MSIDNIIINDRRVVFFAAAAGAGGADVAIDLTLESEWVRSCGIAPDVNYALVPYTVFEQIADATDLVGQVEFYFDPASDLGIQTPNLVLKKIRLVDVQPVDWGVVDGDPLEVVKILKYKLSFADRREKFTWPFGGHLALGEINKEPFDAVDMDANGHSRKNPQELAWLCADAMGIDRALISNRLSDLPTLLNLEWRGSHAPTELAKILHQCGFVMHVTAAGDVVITRIGDGVFLNVPPAQYLPGLSFPAIDRRGKTVVFTSCPNAILETLTITGPEDDEGDDSWQFVIQDSDGDWKLLTDTTFFATADPVATVKAGFKDIPEQYRARVAGQLFRCVRLDADKYGPSLVRRRMVLDQLPIRDVEFNAKIAIPDPDGVWNNSKDFVRCRIAAMLDDGRVLQTVEVLGQVSGATTDPTGQFQKIGTNDLKVRCTREKFEKDDQGRWNPAYFFVGFIQDKGGIKKLNESATKNVLATPDAAIVRLPHLRLLRVDGQDVNRRLIEQMAENMAPRYVRDSGQPATMVFAKGYCGGDNSGRISKIRYSQEKVLTTFETLTWFLPHDQYVTPAELQNKGHRSEKFPEQHETAVARAAAGESGSTQPAVIMQPAAPPPSRPGMVKVHITSNAQGGGKYLGKIVGGRVTSSASTNLVEPEGMADSASSDVVLHNLFEDPANNGLHLLKPGYYDALPVGSGTDGIMIAELESCRCGATGGGSTMLTASLEAANADSVENADYKIVNVPVLCRAVYNELGDDTIYVFMRMLGFFCGRLTTVSAETRVTVAVTDLCP